MGKFKKNRPSIKLLNVPLDQQISENSQAQIKVKKSQKVRNRREDDDQVYIFIA